MIDSWAGFDALTPLDKTAEDKRDPVHTWIHRNWEYIDLPEVFYTFCRYMWRFTNSAVLGRFWAS